MRILLLLATIALAGTPHAAPLDAAALQQGGDIAYRKAISPAAKARKLNADPAVAVRARRIATRIITGAPAIDPAAREFAWAINVVGDASPSLVVYPGGRVVVHDALVTQPGIADDEIAAIVAHMMSHSLLGHDATRIAERVGDAAGAADPNRRAIAVADAAIEILPSIRYTPEEIQAADRESVQLMARAAYDPRAAGSAWRRLRGVRGSLAERVPVTDERLAALDAAIREAVPVYEETRTRAMREPPQRSRPPVASPMIR